MELKSSAAHHVENASIDDEAVQKLGTTDKFGAHVKTDPREIALPILWLMYFFNFLDRNAMVNGKLNSLSKDLKLKGSEYNTCVLRPSWYMAGFMAIWSTVSFLTYLVHDYKTMLVARFFLGITEAPFYPGALYMISQFYTKKEVATRMSIFYTGNMLASAFSGLIAAGVFASLDGVRGLAGWRWLFIIQGALSIGVSFGAFVLLPDSPLKTRWLTAPERELAHSRMVLDTTARREEGSSVWTGLREAVGDYRTWIFCLMDNLHLSANGFKNFLPTAVKTLGFSTTSTLVLTCPPYLVAGVASIVVSWSSGRFNERTWHITVSKAVAILGFALSVATLNTATRYVGIVLFVGATYGVNNIILGWTASTLGQTNEKKAVAIALANTLGNLASVYTPYLWPDSDAPRFLTAMMASIAFSLGVVICAWIMRIALKRTNKKLQEQGNVVTVYVY
ncbi:mfs transporter [Venturia nashicola]|nr:mfs transporter [Venturia nashicola]